MASFFSLAVVRFPGLWTAVGNSRRCSFRNPRMSVMRRRSSHMELLGRPGLRSCVALARYWIESLRGPITTDWSLCAAPGGHRWTR